MTRQQPGWINSFLCLVLFACMGCGFFDFERAESTKIVGSIYAVNLNLPEHPGFYIVLRLPSGYERHLLVDRDTVDYLKSDDSLMLVKAKREDNPVFYAIRHERGAEVSDIREVPDSLFAEYETKITNKYYFSSRSK